MGGKRWSELSGRQRALLAAAGILAGQVTLVAAVRICW